ncbi:2Fe-2S iron-sulfur cluster binding domain-containing protein [Diaphorobacter sp. HDW4A]|uniref:globin domain-containing protein n=1 Tax=Diaphorobacter sp. HDW4A TaxID=2714924 RepID=UPI00140D954A|nr:2Fe-2S iron-sulfur cluster-binding protein [Diaphorobacter sp. HDW4A]QIL81059.1 2Fe-2S iron-sulfur cluster binding domain-containing protein [Diaphorobacter sp. HDW4A]
MSHVLSFENGHAVAQEGETVLNALLRAGLEPAFSCKSGSCQTCMLQAERGDIPERAQRVLPTHLRRLRYFLPCRCVPTGAMQLRRPHPNDLVVGCQLCEASVQADGCISLVFETGRPLKYRSGQQMRVVTGAENEPLLTLTSCPERDLLISGVVDADAASLLPRELQGTLGDEETFGHPFELRGPFDDMPPRELPAPDADAALWEDLGGDAKVRAVMEAFYAKVYADEQLAPFFVKVTRERAIDKQFSFMKQCVTGGKLYMGDRPRNAHHWMIITHALFDHRQALMHATLVEHGLSDALIERWTVYEEYFRPDIVKSARLPRTLGNQVVRTTGVTREVLGEGSVCDQCGGEVTSGETVLLHHHMGTISCERCSPANA